MKITDAKTFVVKTPAPHIGGPYWIFVKLYTDNGLDGVGEVFGIPFRGHVIARMIGDIAESYVIGMDPFKIEKLWRTVYHRGYLQQPDLSLMGVLSGIDMALWDIVGKACNQPLYNLFGGKIHERLRSYTYLYPRMEDIYDPETNEVNVSDAAGLWHNPDWMAARAQDYLKEGWNAVKFDPIMPMTIYDPRQIHMNEIERAGKVIGAVRESVGTRADILLGTHGQFTPAAAVRLAKRIERYFPLWFEEPVPPEDVEAMAMVARSTTIPIATGERLATKFAFAPLIRQRACAIIQPDLGRVGGLMELKKIIGMAEAHYMQIAPHLYCGPVAAAATVQIDACSPNFLIQECIQTFGGFHGEILKKPLRWEEGYLIPPTEPGLGIELNEDVARAHPLPEDYAFFPEIDIDPIQPGEK
jgi:2-dehydro-3-deoxyphosphogalactonate aldolase